MLVRKTQIQLAHLISVKNAVLFKHLLKREKWSYRQTENFHGHQEIFCDLFSSSLDVIRLHKSFTVLWSDRSIAWLCLCLHLLPKTCFIIIIMRFDQLYQLQLVKPS